MGVHDRVTAVFAARPLSGFGVLGNRGRAFFAADPVRTQKQDVHCLMGVGVAVPERADVHSVDIAELGVEIICVVPGASDEYHGRDDYADDNSPVPCKKTEPSCPMCARRICVSGHKFSRSSLHVGPALARPISKCTVSFPISW